MEYLAHSARDGIPSQSYLAHIRNVLEEAQHHAEKAAKYASDKEDAVLLVQSVYNAALVHDMGKLNGKNQAVLHEADNLRPLPVHHQDAGVAHLKNERGSNTFLSQLAVYSHHSGLPDMPEEKKRGNNTHFRDNNPETRKLVNAELPELVRCHRQLLPTVLKPVENSCPHSNPAVFYRMVLSCLADADHSDTARHYGKYPTDEKMPDLRAEERLAALNNYVEKKSSDGKRNHLRAEMYRACRDYEAQENIVSCDSPVGTGKTTAIMANLLQQAICRGSRRIFVILPFTNIIKQSVDTYRKALVLPGEDPKSVVAELHHRADFESEDVRHLSSNWKAPIIVTTAVAFFETLSSNRPAGLRRLHELPGSVIFVDEAHAAVPVRLLPVTWRWMKSFADEWGCYWVLASGSLVKFWELPEIGEESGHVPQIVSEELRNRLSCFEKQRVEYRFRSERLRVDELVHWVHSAPGPRLLIMNTVKSAAVVAEQLKETFGENCVLHLSTALKAEDREKTVDDVKKRLEKEGDIDWMLVATSCVEAGMDFSFRTGFREVSSLLSLLQASGRVNREGKNRDAVMWSFQMRDDEAMRTKNLAVEASSEILVGYFEDGKRIAPELSTDSIGRELAHNTIQDEATKLVKDEKSLNFKAVDEKYHVIESDTVLVVVDEDIKNAIKYSGCNWQDIQKKAVSVSRSKIENYKLPELADGIYDWNLGYDSFLGIMQGVLNCEKVANPSFFCSV